MADHKARGIDEIESIISIHSYSSNESIVSIESDSEDDDYDYEYEFDDEDDVDGDVVDENAEEESSSSSDSPSPPESMDGPINPEDRYHVELENYEESSAEDEDTISTASSYSTIGSTIASVSSIFDEYYPEIHQLHRHIALEDLALMEQLFADSPDQQMARDQLRDLFEQFGKYFKDETFEEIFLKMNTTRNETVGWNEFITFLITLFHSKEGSTEVLQKPIIGLPETYKTDHEFPVKSLLFCPTVEEPGCPKLEFGRYVTASEDGTIKFWDMDWTLERSEQAKRFIPKITKTMVLDCTCLPDMRMVCVSTVDHDIRFYDFGTSVFVVRFVIENFPHQSTSLSYFYAEDRPGVDSKLLIGDDGGGVNIIEFDPADRGPFQLQIGQSCNIKSYQELSNGSFKAMRLTTFNAIHHQPVHRIEYFEVINAFISVAACNADIIVDNDKLAFEPPNKPMCPGLVIGYIGSPPLLREFHADRGMSCFAYTHVPHPLLATGGPDMIVRLWSPRRPRRSKALLKYHEGGVCFMFFQDNGKYLYSVDKLKEVNVWDTISFELVQNYTQFTEIFDRMSPLVAFYNDVTRELSIVADFKVAVVKCRPRIDLLTTDGYTHTMAVSVILYNELYRFVITCGYDSNILVWEPSTGVRHYLIKEAHTIYMFGIFRVVEIMCGCLDPKQQQLLTGARDGTIKIWNFLDGICTRHLSIEPDCAVTSVYWITDRILATGWNGRITEFADQVDEVDYGRGKEWECYHDGLILCALVKAPRLVVTGSSRGELVMWDLTTGQPYRKHNVADPNTLIEIDLHKKKRRSVRISAQIKKVERKKQIGERKLSVIPVPELIARHQRLRITAMLYLDTRPNRVDTATVLTAVSNGKILAWSHHTVGKCVGDFNAIHIAGDKVLAMTTDKANKYLFTGTTLGYVKVWLLENAWYPQDGLGKVQLPALRIKFPFLWKDVIDGRAKRRVKNQTTPMLLSSFKGHTLLVMDLVYLDTSEILISTSRDKSARMWSLGGRYIGTLGSSVGWPEFNRDKPLSSDHQFRLPPDIQRECSFTTLKVLNGGTVERLFVKTADVEKEAKEEFDPTEEIMATAQIMEDYKSLLVDPAPLQMAVDKPVLDTSYSTIPIYKHSYIAPMTGLLSSANKF